MTPLASVKNLGVDGKTIGDMFANRARATPEHPAFRSKRGGRWVATSWRDARERAEAIAHGFLALGLSLGERMAIVAGTREEWALGDLALTMAGGITVPIYPSSLPDQCAFILNDSECVLVLVENAKQLAKLSGVRGELGALRRVVVIDPAGITPDPWVTTLDQVIAEGHGHKEKNPGALYQVLAQQSGKTIATIIYTSGTTGNPKGVVMSHDAFTLGTRLAISSLPIVEADEQLLFLPLAHSFGKMLSVVAVRVGFCTAFAESIDKLVENMGEVRPSFMAGVPRIFEKVYGNFLGKAKEGSPLKWRLVSWALKVGIAWSKEIQAGRKPGTVLAIEHLLADRLVFSKLRERFGGRLRWFISGSAPLSPELAEFFHGAGMLILEGYGLTETNSMTSINRQDHFKFGTVGKVVHPDIQVNFAPDGEILIKGITNLNEYYRLPEATKEVIDPDGFFHTGDIGEIDSEGFIRITDRKKDLIKTSGGKYVAPQLIEGQLKMHPLVSQAVVIGDQRKYVTALIAVNADVARRVIEETGGQVPGDPQALLQHEAVKKGLEGRVAEINKKLGSWEQVKYFRVLPRELSEADGEVTPTLKVKRKVVSERYRDLIDSMYQERGGGGDRE